MLKSWQEVTWSTWQMVSCSLNYCHFLCLLKHLGRNLLWHRYLFTEPSAGRAVVTYFLGRPQAILFSFQAYIKMAASVVLAMCLHGAVSKSRHKKSWRRIVITQPPTDLTSSLQKHQEVVTQPAAEVSDLQPQQPPKSQTEIAVVTKRRVVCVFVTMKRIHRTETPQPPRVTAALALYLLDAFKFRSLRATWKMTKNSFQSCTDRGQVSVFTRESQAQKAAAVCGKKHLQLQRNQTKMSCSH